MTIEVLKSKLIDIEITITVLEEMMKKYGFESMEKAELENGIGFWIFEGNEYDVIIEFEYDSHHGEEYDFDDGEDEWEYMESMPITITEVSKYEED